MKHLDTLNCNKLNNGILIPKIMLGTYNIDGEDAHRIFNIAFQIGFRGIDCGRYYKNEMDWGNAIKESGVDRENIFIQTKVDYSLERMGLNILEDFEKTLENFQTHYIDSLLIHWPVYETFIETWKALENLYRAGKVRAIGVCNFRIEHFEILKKHAAIMPMIAQIERHPCRKQQELVDYCQKNSIQVEAYQPLAVTRPQLMNNNILIEIAKSHKCSVPQVALAWNIQSGVIPLPKSSNPERLKQNFDSTQIFLTKEEINNINGDQDHYFRAMREASEFPGYWDHIHRVDIDKYLG